MQINCPNCSTSYQVTAASIGAAGRSVRCARCKNTWFVSPEAEQQAEHQEPNWEMVAHGAAEADAQAAAVREYVRSGGGLVVTGETSLCDELGRPRRGPTAQPRQHQEDDGRLIVISNRVSAPKGSTSGSQGGLAVALAAALLQLPKYAAKRRQVREHAARRRS